MLLLEGTRGIDRIHTTNAVCYDQATIDALQKGGFVYLTYEYSAAKPFVAPVARLADDTGTNWLKKKTIYPVFIARAEPGTPRDDFKPIDNQGLITIIQDHGFECFVTDESYFQDGGVNYADIQAGDALKIVNSATTDNKPKLVVDNSGAGTIDTTVAVALTSAIEGKVRILWL